VKHRPATAHPTEKIDVWVRNAVAAGAKLLGIAAGFFLIWHASGAVMLLLTQLRERRILRTMIPGRGRALGFETRFDRLSGESGNRSPGATMEQLPQEVVDPDTASRFGVVEPALGGGGPSPGWTCLFPCELRQSLT
jgi:hypothetical protein